MDVGMAMAIPLYFNFTFPCQIPILPLALLISQQRHLQTTYAHFTLTNITPPSKHKLHSLKFPIEFLGNYFYKGILRLGCYMIPLEG